MNLTRRQLDIFLALAATRNLAKAADRVALSASAYTRALQALEDQLGVRLVERTTRRVALTVSGERFLPVARRLAGDIDDALVVLRGGTRELAGWVGVATGTAFGSTVLTQALRDFTVAHAQVQVRLLDSNSQGTTQSVQRGDVDFGIGTALGSADGVTTQTLLHAPLGLLLPPGARVPRRAVPGGLRLIKESEDTSIMQLLRTRAPAWADSMAGGVETSSLSLQLALVRAGVGATVLSALGASHPLAHGLRFVPLTPKVERPVMLMTRRDRPLKPAAAALVAATLAALRGATLAHRVRLHHEPGGLK
jgi:DNA-binding transcriptional LysR family regulator